MIGLILASVIGVTELPIPDPYLGFGFTTFSEKYGSDERRKKFFLLGLPVTVKTFEPKGYHPIPLRVTPEVFISHRLIGMMLALGPEFDFRLGYRHAFPSAMTLGLQGGGYYAYLHDTKNYVIDETTQASFSASDKNSLAAVIHVYFGPRFEAWDLFSFRFLIHTKIMMGKISKFTGRSEFSNNVGLMNGFTFQFVF